MTQIIPCRKLGESLMLKSNQSLNKSLIASAIAIALASTSSFVNAQETKKVNKAKKVEIEKILITAQKRTENLQEVPVSVSALSNSEMEGLKLRSTTEIAAQIPNMQIATPYGDGFPVISLRGVSMNDFSLNQSSPVAVYVDEVFKGNPALQGVQLFDLERVEVLRGPQGTLYGKNTTGGAVNFITQKADFDREAYVKVGAGSYNRKEFQGAFQTSLIDDLLAVRVAGTWAKADGWMKNKNSGFADASATDEWGGRASFTLTPSDDLTANLSITSSRSTPVNYGILAQVGPAGVGVGNQFYELFSTIGGAIGGTNGGESSSYTREGLSDFEIESNRDAKREIDTESIALTLNWGINENLTLTSITSWDEGVFISPEDADGSPLKVIESDFSSEAEQVSQDLRITSNYDGPFNFIAGLYYAKETIEVATNTRLYNDLDINQDGMLNTSDCLDPVLYAFGFGGPDFGMTTPNADVINAVLPTLGLGINGLADFALLGCQLDNDFEQVRTSNAVYADGNYALTDKLTLRAGVRYTKDDNDLNDMSARIKDNQGNDMSPHLGETIPAMSLSNTDKEWTGKIGIDYLTDDGILVYTNYSTGFRSGAYNAQAFLAPDEVNYVDPETIDSFEIGFKSTFLDNRVQLNGAAFHYDYKNQQFLNIDTTTLAQTLVNIDSSTLKGLELEMVAVPLEALNITAGLGLVDSKVNKGMLSGVDLSGNSLVAAPELNINLAADYFIELESGAFLSFHVDANYVDEQYFDVFNTSSIKSDNYWLSNARISYDTESDSSEYSIAFWIKNITDETYVNQAYDLQGTFGLDLLNIGAPRMAGIEFTWRYF